jgi:surface protein
MFSGCASFVEAISFWNVENAVNMGSMFTRCAKFNADISLWKTPRNEQMFNMFSECEEFNSNLALWDVSHVVDMRDLLAGASKFNKPIGHWNTSSVTNMQDMFRRAVSFSQDISKWDVRNVVDFSGMFKDAIKFAGDVSKWDVDWPHSSITFANMFSGALAFNNKWVCETSTSGPPDTCELKEPYFFNALGNRVFSNNFTELQGAVCNCLGEEPIHGICTEFARESEYGVLPQWDVSLVQDFEELFDASVLLPRCGGTVTELSLSLFDADLSHWNMKNATDTAYMFRFLPKFKGKGLKYWDVSSVTRMDRMFDANFEFKEAIGYWDTSHVTNMEKMFRDAHSFNQDISKWDTSSVRIMFRMFLNAREFKGTGISKWDVEEVVNMQEMFLNATHFNDDIGSTWLGSAAISEQNDIFLGADAFNKVYECNTDVDGPVSSCAKQRAPSPWRCD